MNKKGFMEELIITLVIGFVCILFFAGWLYGSNLVKGVLTDTSLDTAEVNVTQAVYATANYVFDGYSQLRTLAFIMMFAFILGTLVTAFLSRKSKLAVPIYIFVTVLLTILAITISSSYTNLLTDSTMNAMLGSFTLGNIMMQYLPIWIAVIGLVGIVLSVVARYVGDDL